MQSGTSVPLLTCYQKGGSRVQRRLKQHGDADADVEFCTCRVRRWWLIGLSRAFRPQARAWWPRCSTPAPIADITLFRFIMITIMMKNGFECTTAHSRFFEWPQCLLIPWALKLDQRLRLDELRCSYNGYHARDYAARVQTLKTKWGWAEEAAKRTSLNFSFLKNSLPLALCASAWKPQTYFVNHSQHT